MARRHIKEAMYFSFSNINIVFIFGIFYTGFCFFLGHPVYLSSNVMFTVLVLSKLKDKRNRTATESQRFKVLPI